MVYDDLLRKVHGARFEWKMRILFLLNGFPNSLFISSLVLVMYLPEDYRCTLPDQASSFIEKNPNAENATLEYLIPYHAETGQRSKCEIYNRTTEDVTLFLNNFISQNGSVAFISNASTIACDRHTFNNPMGIHSLAIEFDWTCGNAWMKPVLTTIYLVAKAIATASGFLADRIGRRLVFNISTFLLFGILFLQSFATSTMIYGAVLFLCGLTSLVNFLTGFVLGAECTTPEQRNYISICSFLSYSFGYGISTLIFYMSPDWRWCLRIYGMLGVFYIANLWHVPESPRWLMSQGRVEEAKDVLRKIAKCNNKSTAVIDELLEDVEKETEVLTQEQENQTDKKRIERGKILKSIFKSPAMLGLLFVASYSWFSAALVYYGITLSVHALSGNIYVNNALMGLVEIPGLAFAFFTVKYMSRPLSHGGIMILAGIFCMGVALLSQVSPLASTVAGLIGKSLNNSAFYIVYIHTTEVFPTVVRNTCMGWGSFSGRMGSILSPYIIYMIDLYGLHLPYLIMSLITVSSGVLTLLVFPETLNVELPETVDDCLKLKRLYHSSCKRTFFKRRKRFCVANVSNGYSSSIT